MVETAYMFTVAELLEIATKVKIEVLAEIERSMLSGKYTESGDKFSFKGLTAILHEARDRDYLKHEESGRFYAGSFGPTPPPVNL